MIAPRSLVADEVRVADGRRWRRVLLRTRWLTESDDLGGALAQTLSELPGAAARPGDVLAVAEKVAVVTSGRGVPTADIRAGRFARSLAASVRPVGDSKGLSVPEKMQYVVDTAGRSRVLAGVAAAALTRPFGISGAFFRVVGPVARDLDGARPPYQDTLLPALNPGEARMLAHHLAARLHRAVAIVDINDRGGSIRAVTTGGPDPAVLLRLLRDNPLGHCSQSTPLVLLRPLD